LTTHFSKSPTKCWIFWKEVMSSLLSTIISTMLNWYFECFGNTLPLNFLI
jgi:hypothetical protein